MPNPTDSQGLEGEEHVHQSDGSTANPSKLRCKSCGETYVYDTNLTNSLKRLDPVTPQASDELDRELDKILGTSDYLVRFDEDALRTLGWKNKGIKTREIKTSLAALTTKAREQAKQEVLDELVALSKRGLRPGDFAEAVMDFIASKRTKDALFIASQRTRKEE